MLEMGIIECSTCKWCSQIVLVLREEGTLRFCIDIRHINSMSRVDPYPMPHINDLLERVGRVKFITTVDLSKGYWQVPLAKRAKKLTAFRTAWFLYHFTVMPFGLQCRRKFWNSRVHIWIMWWCLLKSEKI